MYGGLFSQVGAEGWVAIIGAISAGVCAIVGTAFAFLKWFVPFYYNQREKSAKRRHNHDLEIGAEYKVIIESERAQKEKVIARLDKQQAEIDLLKEEGKRCRKDYENIVKELTKLKYQNRNLRLKVGAILTSGGKGCLIIADSDGTIVRASPEAYRLFHWQSDELEGENIQVLMPHRLRRFHVAAVTKVLESGEESSDIKRVDSFGVMKEHHRQEDTLGKEFPITIFVNWFRVENGHSHYMMSAEIYPKLPDDDDSDLGKSDEKQIIK